MWRFTGCFNFTFLQSCDIALEIPYSYFSFYSNSEKMDIERLYNRYFRGRSWAEEEGSGAPFPGTHEVCTCFYVFSVYIVCFFWVCLKGFWEIGKSFLFSMILKSQIIWSISVEKLKRLTGVSRVFFVFRYAFWLQNARKDFSTHLFIFGWA
ncbi:unnamed protein product [Cuscuta europaea]|uniref:Uncharacterized protein n=1 Tax=Cuscuta europaea TaxID=41803 RepID=A0A9P0YPM0_CUSEU|nr:unnamed protein product [Cuscuta europaea]